MSTAMIGSGEDARVLDGAAAAAAVLDVLPASFSGGSRAALAGFGGSRPPAFAAAGRHSQRVRFLRRAIVVVCVSAIGLLGFVSVFNPLGRLKGGLAVGSVGISGTKVIMHDPKLSGMRRDGHPYEVKAATATQDTTTPALLDLTVVDLRLGQSDGSTTRITSETGRYDTDAERLDLAGNVRFLNQGHYDMALEDAVMDLKGGELRTAKPAVVTIPSGRVQADALLFTEGTHVMAFEGRVRSVFTTDGGETPTPIATAVGTGATK